MPYFYVCKDPDKKALPKAALLARFAGLGRVPFHRETSEGRSSAG